MIGNFKQLKLRHLLLLPEIIFSGDLRHSWSGNPAFQQRSKRCSLANVIQRP